MDGEMKSSPKSHPFGIINYGSASCRKAQFGWERAISLKKKPKDYEDDDTWPNDYPDID